MQIMQMNADNVMNYDQYMMETNQFRPQNEDEFR